MTPHTPQQNGAAERLNRTLIEGMLAYSNLPHRFWAEALSTCVYLRNHSSTKAIRGITPYEAWNGIKPDVSHFHVFECAAFVHVPKVQRHKLDSKARKCSLLGYGANQKGNRLYDIEYMKVFSRDVVFDETSMPGIQKDSVVKDVELEINKESSVGTRTHETSGSVSDITTGEGRLSKESLKVSSSSEIDLRRSTRNKQHATRQIWS